MIKVNWLLKPSGLLLLLSCHIYCASGQMTPASVLPVETHEKVDAQQRILLNELAQRLMKSSKSSDQESGKLLLKHLSNNSPMDVLDRVLVKILAQEKFEEASAIQDLLDPLIPGYSGELDPGMLTGRSMLRSVLGMHPKFGPRMGGHHMNPNFMQQGGMHRAMGNNPQQGMMHPQGPYGQSPGLPQMQNQWPNQQMFNQGMQPQGMLPQGMNPQGMHPQGMFPQGMHPQGMHPQGMHSQGMHPQGMHSQGMHPQGMPPQGMQGMNPMGYPGGMYNQGMQGLGK